ncbi:peptide ABC transporter substrate-binding protein [Eubacteriales bacterium mix99]
MKKVVAALLAALMIVSLSACGNRSTESRSTGSSGNSGTGSGGGARISMVMTSDPDTLDPGRADDTQKNQIVLETQETLVRLIDGKLSPAGAESYEPSGDGLVWTFHLRSNKYSDGTEVQAQDYVNSIRRVFDPEVNCHNAGIFYCIKGGEDFNTGKGSKEDVGAEAVDEKTLKITLTEPLPYFPQLLTFSNITPVPESRTKGGANSSYGATAKELAQSGPYYVSDWTRGTQVILKKNPNYWDADHIKLDGIDMPLAQDENTRQQLFDTGKIDILSNVREEYVTSLQSRIDSGDIQFISEPQASNSYICFNNSDPGGVFTNEKIRKAFAIAFDRDAYVKKVVKKGKAAGGLIPYGLSIGTDEFRKLYDEPMSELLSQDPKMLLEEGLKEIGKAGQTLEVTFLQSNPDNDTKVIAEYYQNQWQSKLGVKVKIETASDNSSFNNQVSKGLYQICQTGWGADYNDPMTFFQCYTTGDGNNPAFFTDETYDQLVNACKTESDMARRGENFAKAEKILTVDKCGISPITFGYQNIVLNKNLKGVYINGAGGPSIELRDAYMGK